VIGARAAAWAPCPGLASVIVLDAHDEGLVQQQAPTWDAPSVARERARRAGVPCFLVSACPTLALITGADDVLAVGSSEEREGWAAVIAVDRRGDDPRLGLYSKALVDTVRNEQRRVVCVLNRRGRAQLLDCGACGELATCEQCGAAVAMFGERLVCRRCQAGRPVVCQGCGSDALRLIRPGVTKIREQMEALIGRPTGEVAAGTGPVPDTSVLVGTEAVLYREAELRKGGGVGVVAFLDFDQELLAPRYRAGEEALALLARAARLVGGRDRHGRVLVQTRAPSHPVVTAAVMADPTRLTAAEEPVRKALRLPPFAALAILAGPGADELASGLGALSATPDRATSGRGFLEVSRLSDERWAVRARDQGQMADALAAVGRPAGRVRVEVGPLRF
jgi:primosomal protein N' (replication factor Y) (superfamily II helicase)